jgi:hypothetical protein
MDLQVQFGSIIDLLYDSYGYYRTYRKKNWEEKLI